MCVVEMKQLFIDEQIINEQLNGQSFSCFDSPNCDKFVITHALILFQTRFFLFKSRVERLLNGYAICEMSPDVELESRNRNCIERLMKTVFCATNLQWWELYIRKETCKFPSDGVESD